jgi:mRNA-degrading endonuclease RelE of RelBE toxin-antitoxin system
MTASYRVEVSTHFERELRKLSVRHPDLVEHFARVLEVLQHDPFNRSRTHAIRKLRGVASGDGQYRIRSGRLRFRYDIEGSVVYLKAVALRNEATYR